LGLVLHIITRPFEGQFHVCRVIPGRPPLSVANSTSHGEAMDVCIKLDLMNDDDDITEEPVPGELDELLCRL
jgi:hypothetical protein